MAKTRKSPEKEEKENYGSALTPHLAQGFEEENDAPSPPPPSSDDEDYGSFFSQREF
jgi:hypothetical protein